MAEIEGGDEGVRLVVAAPATAERRRDRRLGGDRRRLPHRRGGRRRAHRFPCGPRDAAPLVARAVAGRRRGQRRACAARRRSARRPPRAGPRRRCRPGAVGRSGRRGPAARRRGAGGHPPLLRREGLDRGRGRLAHRRGAPRGRLLGRARAHTRSRRRRSASLVPGREVNLEVDVLAKYVERLLGPGRARSPDTDAATMAR